LRGRYPTISFAKILLVVALFGVLFDAVIEVPMIFLHLWNYAGFPDSSSVVKGSTKYPLALFIGAALFWGGFGIIRNWKNDKGETVFERRLDHIRSPRRRTALTLLSLIAFAQVILFAADLECAVFGLYASPYRGLPAHVVNAACDTSGFKDTRYGPCPGSPGYKMPVRELPGKAP
jgi:hypothetical protein